MKLKYISKESIYTTTAEITADIEKWEEDETKKEVFRANVYNNGFRTECALHATKESALSYIEAAFGWKKIFCGNLEYKKKERWILKFNRKICQVIDPPSRTMEEELLSFTERNNLVEIDEDRDGDGYNYICTLLKPNSPSSTFEDMRLFEIENEEYWEAYPVV